MIEYRDHRGYVGEFQWDNDAHAFYGRVAGLRDVVTFQGATFDEVRQAFRDSVDDYLEFCAERGETPEVPGGGETC